MGLSYAEAVQITRLNKVYKIQMTGAAIQLSTVITDTNIKAICINNADSGNGVVRWAHVAADIDTEGYPIAEEKEYAFETDGVDDVYVYGTDTKYIYVHVASHG